MTYLFLSTQNLKKDTFNKLPIGTFTGFAYAIIPIIIFIFPGILYGIPRAIQTINIPNEEEELPIGQPRENDLNDPLTETAERILTYFEQSKPYLNTKFSIDDIAEELNIPKHHVGYCFTNIIQTKFTTLRTDYRIAHAKRLLLSSQVDVMTMEGIGLESGFASKSSFFSVFKESTGLSPFDYMKQHKNQGTYRKFPKNHSENFNKPEVI
jgi:AraC-like DNA-binding protein